jgi:hypothetical protein
MNPRFPLRKSLATLALTILTASALQAGTPRVGSAYPSGVTRGSEIEINFNGSNLQDARTVLFNEPGFEVTWVETAANKFTAKIKAPANARIGEHLYRVVTDSGIADLRPLYVLPFPLVEEMPAKEKTAKGVNATQPISLGTTVYGRTQNEDQDHYEVELKKGQRLSVEVIGFQLQTQNPYDPHVTIRRPDGEILTQVDDTPFARTNPVTSILAPEDGKYRITIKETTNSGVGECHYLMSVGTFPRPVASFPLGGQPDKEQKFALNGDVSGPREKVVKLPAKNDSLHGIIDEDGQPAPSPVNVRVIDIPNVLEAEPNNAITEVSAEPVALPAAFNGIINDRTDVDHFKFSAKKGEAFDIRVFARALRSGADTIISVLNEKGATLGSNDDANGPDSYLRWTSPADGTFFLSVRDQQSRSGPTFGYRAEITKVQPKVTAALPEMTINSSQDRRAIVVPRGNRYASMVRIKRSDWAGGIALEPQGLPAGVKASFGPIDKSTDTIAMVFEAAPDAPLAATRFGFKFTPQDPAAPAFINGVEHKVDVAENGNQRAFYTVIEDALSAAITEELPVSLELVQPKVPLMRNGQMQLKVKVNRKEGFDKPFDLNFIYAPNGIGTAGVQKVEEKATEGAVTISANGNAALQKWKVCVVGNADFGKGNTFFSTQLIDLEIVEPIIEGTLERAALEQGAETEIKAKLDVKTPFEGKAKVQLVSLPPDVTSEEKEISAEDKEITFKIKAGSTSPAGLHKQVGIQFSLTKDGEPFNTVFASGGIIRIDKASAPTPAAKSATSDVAPAKPATAATTSK